MILPSYLAVLRRVDDNVAVGVNRDEWLLIFAQMWWVM